MSGMSSKQVCHSPLACLSSSSFFLGIGMHVTGVETRADGIMYKQASSSPKALPLPRNWNPHCQISREALNMLSIYLNTLIPHRSGRT